MFPEDPNCPIDYEPCIRDNTTCADFAQPKSHLSADQAALLTTQVRPAELISTPHGEFATALLSHGCTLKRHAYAMSLDLTTTPQQVEAHQPLDLSTVFIENLSAEELFDSWYAAYPSTHPDFLAGSRDRLIVENLQPLLDRSLLGANHRSSRAVLLNESVIAGIIISLREGKAPYGGPWVSEIWCTPQHQHRGIGRSLLWMAIAELSEDGFTSLGLAVSHGNPAKKLYESLGFVEMSESWTIVLPAEAPKR